EPCQSRPMANGRCRMHGGKSLGGIASSNYKSGRYSKYIPKDLADKYNEARGDPDLLSLNDDVALLRSIAVKHLAATGQGDPHPAWLEVQAAYKELDAAISSGDAVKLMAAKNKLGQIIQPNYRAALAENQVSRYLDQVGRIADKERRLMIDRQRMITVERVMLIVTAVVMGLRESVLRYCDIEIASKILSEVNTAYSRATGFGTDRPAIDAGAGSDLAG
ncbi:MAG: hypothetical protein ACREIQ_09560, partial [Nitrospiria bacterium]